MWRKAAAASLVAAPILLAVATGVDPALGDDQGYGIYRQHPDAVQAHSLLLHWAWALFVPGLLGLLTPIRRRGAVLARIAWLAVIFGLITFSALMANDFFLLALEQTLPDARVQVVDERFLALSVTVAGWQWPGLAGWALSLILTPIAAARAGVISWRVAAGALAGMALYLAFAISPVPLCLLGPVVMTVAYTFAARSLLDPASAAPSEPDTFGTFRRRFGLFSMYAAPLTFAAGMATVPDWSGDVADSVASPVLTQVSALFLHYAWVLFVPAVLMIAAQTIRSSGLEASTGGAGAASSSGGVVPSFGGPDRSASRAARFTGVAAGVTVLALINFSGLMVGDSADLAARQALDPATAEKVSETMGGLAAFTFGWALPGMALTLLGLIAVPIGAAVAGATRWWTAALSTAGIVAFLVAGLGPIGVTGPLLLLAGFALMARDFRRPAVGEAVPNSPTATPTTA
ncbi:hypothetical protein AB0M02_13515 [Actinoplanes sp. NPDC051861]|uniref:hypothetical protein n=1 Tax=Actinoplanes sp. NPDC051861 TaxID=3155170 RepID=UPI0034363FAA